jgi:hypothetical protein
LGWKQALATRGGETEREGTFSWMDRRSNILQLSFVWRGSFLAFDEKKQKKLEEATKSPSH